MEGFNNKDDSSADGSESLLKYIKEADLLAEESYEKSCEANEWGRCFFNLNTPLDTFCSDLNSISSAIKSLGDEEYSNTFLVGVFFVGVVSAYEKFIHGMFDACCEQPTLVERAVQKMKEMEDLEKNDKTEETEETEETKREEKKRKREAKIKKLKIEESDSDFLNFFCKFQNTSKNFNKCSLRKSLGKITLNNPSHVSKLFGFLFDLEINLLKDDFVIAMIKKRNHFVHGSQATQENLIESRMESVASIIEFFDKLINQHYIDGAFKKHAGLYSLKANGLGEYMDFTD